MIFRRKETSDQALRSQLNELEQNAQQAHGPGGAALYYNKAGDLLVDAGRVTQALEYYGEAIDTHVKADRFEPASALCRKVIRLVPSVIRTRCTLTWLALGEGYDGIAQEQLTRYVSAAAMAEREGLALTQLRRMTEVAQGDSLRLHLAELLLTLGDSSGADHLYGSVYRERNELDPRRMVPADERRFVARRAALQGPTFAGW
jgi:tetratricopeptide (TPR) repeat protein